MAFRRGYRVGRHKNNSEYKNTADQLVGHRMKAVRTGARETERQQGKRNPSAEQNTPCHRFAHHQVERTRGNNQHRRCPNRSGIIDEQRIHGIDVRIAARLQNKSWEEVIGTAAGSISGTQV